MICDCSKHDIILYTNGSQVGKVCGECKKWLGWVGKKEVDRLERQGYMVMKFRPMPSESKKEKKEEEVNCHKCDSREVNLVLQGGRVALRCGGCNTFLKWLSKDSIERYQKGGKDIIDESDLNIDTTLSKSINSGVSAIDYTYTVDSNIGVDDIFNDREGVTELKESNKDYSHIVGLEEIEVLKTVGNTLNYSCKRGVECALKKYCGELNTICKLIEGIG